MKHLFAKCWFLRHWKFSLFWHFFGWKNVFLQTKTFLLQKNVFVWCMGGSDLSGRHVKFKLQLTIFWELPKHRKTSILRTSVSYYTDAAPGDCRSDLIAQRLLSGSKWWEERLPPSNWQLKTICSPQELRISCRILQYVVHSFSQETYDTLVTKVVILFEVVVDPRNIRS